MFWVMSACFVLVRASALQSMRAAERTICEAARLTVPQSSLHADFTTQLGLLKTQVVQGGGGGGGGVVVEVVAVVLVVAGAMRWCWVLMYGCGGITRGVAVVVVMVVAEMVAMMVTMAVVMTLAR